MVPQGLMDAPWHIDAMLALILAGAAVAQYVAIAIDGHSFAKWLMAIGWTGLALRFWVALAVYGNVTINTASIPFLLCVAGGTMIGVINTIVRAGHPKVWCMREPEKQCQREDRIREAIVQLRQRNN